MQGDSFEWDNKKAAANARKHSVTFEMARDIFSDPFAIDELDERADYGEVRYVITGMVEGRLLFVAYTMRDERIRIISARGAEPYEQRRYTEENR